MRLNRPGRILLLAAILLTSACRSADAVVDDAAARCRAALELKTRGLADTVLAKMVACARDRMRGKLAADTPCDDPAAANFPANGAAAITNAAARLASNATSSCAGVTPATLGFTSCAAPCDATVPAIASFADVAACLACQADTQGGDLVTTLYGTTPPVLGTGDPEHCQDSSVAGQARSYVRAVLKSRRSCQSKVDAGTLSGVDCATADPTGDVATAAAHLEAGVAQCSASDLTTLTSCSTSVSGEQSCVRAAGDAMASALFAATRPDDGGSTTTACAADDFLDLSSAPGAGPGYPAPSLSASCTDTEVVVTSNSIPPYTFVQTTPNALVANQLTYHFPRTPEVAASTTSIPLLNSIAVAVNGLPIFGPNEAATPDPYGDPVANAILDECLGHTAFVYHYHALVVKCLTQAGLVAEPWMLDDPPTDQPSPIVGYAFDGFPIYGPYGCVDAACSQVVEYLSSWDNVAAESVDCTSTAQCSSGDTCALVMVDGVERDACVPKTYAWTNNVYHPKDGAQYLDQCNGHYGPDGTYHYHATATFPYILGCYRGTPTSNTGH